MFERAIRRWEYFSEERKLIFVGLQYVIVIVCLTLSFIQTNMTPFMVGVVGLLWIGVARILSEPGGFKIFYFSHMEVVAREYYGAQPKDAYFSSRWEYFAVVGWVVVAIALSTFFYLPYMGQYQVLDRGQGDVVYRVAWSWYPTPFNTFTTTVRNFWSNQTIRFYDAPNGGGNQACVAQTADKVAVQGDVGAVLELSPEGVPIAYAVANSNAPIWGLAASELCNRFVVSIAGYKLADLPQTLVLENSTASDQRGMNAFGVRYAGPIRVGNLHVYVNQQLH